MFIDNKTFYPTPDTLIRRMLEKIDTRPIEYILEPSCGKGNIIDYYKEYYKNKNSRYIGYDKKIEDYLTFDGIEIDNNLSNLCRGKNINIVWNDFLTFEPQRFYNLIIANFPFNNGCEHLLKAIRIQERIGGQIVCLINAETIKNPYSDNRKALVTLLNDYNADIEYIKNAFTDAERKTGVEIALIYINIPMKNDTTIFEREFKRDNPELKDTDFKSIMPEMNKLEALIFECDLIKKSVVELFKEKMKIDNLLKSVSLNSKIEICDDTTSHKMLSINSYIDKINLEYWHKFINETDLKSKLPSALRDHFIYNIDEQKNISFNMESVRYFYNELINTIPKSYEETVAKLFDDLTSKYVYTDSVWNKTIHYYNGWKTNKSYKINKKVIIKCYHNYCTRLPNELTDLNVVFENISGIKDNLYDNRNIEKAVETFQKNIETEFFVLDSYIKGTLHITFKNQDYLNQFNILAAKGKNWLPSDFGTKQYSDMDDEEKELVKEFGLTVDKYNQYSLQGTNNYLRLNDK